MFHGLQRAPPLILYGFLFEYITGGNIVLLYASKYHDIPAVVNVSGRYDLKRGIAERIGADFMERLKKDGYIDIKTVTGNYMPFLSSITMLNM